jgi:hypothetical protein
MQAYGYTSLPAMYWLLNPLYVREDGVVEGFLAQLEERDIWPGLIVLDTLSRSFGGGEENSSADMGAFVDRMTQLAQGRRMAALVVHHTNATGQRERGHTAFRGGLDMMFRSVAELDRDGLITRLSIENDKCKDDTRTATIYLAPKRDVPLPSLVFEETTAPPAKTRGTGEPTPMRKQDMLQLLSVSEQGLTWGEWRIAANLDKHRFNRRVRRLLAEGEIYREDGRYLVMPALGDLAEDDPT